MRLIGTIENLKQAQRFSAWLIAEGLENQLEEDTNRVQVWVKDEDQVARASQELRAFLDNPEGQKYLDAVPRAKEAERKAEARRKAFEKNVVNVRQDQRGKKAPLTISLIVISSLVALLTSFGELKNTVWFEALTFTEIPLERLQEENVPLSKELLATPQIKFWSISRGEIWRLVTPIFIHFGTLHVVFNMIWLFQLGRLIEFRYGTWVLGAMVLASAAISNGVQVAVPQGISLGVNENGNIIAALGGMSGVVYALFGFVWIKSLIDPASRFYLPQSTVVLMLGWLVFCMSPVSGQLLEGGAVANWAHGAGIVCGVIIAYLSTMLSNRRAA